MNFSKPLSAFSSGDNNVASFMIAQRDVNINNAIHYIVDLYFDDVDLSDPVIIRSIMKKYELQDLNKQEKAYIKKEVHKLISTKGFY